MGPLSLQLVAFATWNLDCPRSMWDLCLSWSPVATVLCGIYAPTQLPTHARCPTPTFRKPEIQKSIELFVSRCVSSGCLSTSLQKILTDQRLPYTFAKRIDDNSATLASSKTTILTTNSAAVGKNNGAVDLDVDYSAKPAIGKINKSKLNGSWLSTTAEDFGRFGFGRHSW